MSHPSRSPDSPSRRFGLIVIGDEVLNGTRRDGHLEHFKQVINRRGHALAWFWMLPDDPEMLEAHLRRSMSGADPVFVCGGIGATPDDHTRACAAAAADVELIAHPEAVALIEARFGTDAYPHRILMAHLPAASALIPNPVNQIPGFALRQHWFLPGFPSMAWPMAEWVLDQHYGHAEPLLERALEVRGVPESELIPLMREFGERFPTCKCFSLPHMGEDAHILLGLRGRGEIDTAYAALCEHLHQSGIACRPPAQESETHPVS